MTAQRVVFHYGIEFEGLKYNGPELGELRRRMGVGAKVELTFDPGDLGHVNVLDPQKGNLCPRSRIGSGLCQGTIVLAEQGHPPVRTATIGCTDRHRSLGAG